MNKELKYQVGLTLLPGIGDVLAKSLVAYCGSAEAVFRERKSLLQKIPGIGHLLSDAIWNQDIMERAEEEVAFIQKAGIQPVFFLDENYPSRLKHCQDSPVMLYFKGDADLNPARIVSIVGTRDATEYGKEMCRKLVEELAPYQPLIMSGLAYGIDICAHRAAVANGLPTIAVLAHGLDRLYPAVHRSTVQKMLKNGGIMTDFRSKTNPDRENFPKRNRIVAGIADATIVVESKKGGGSLITANIANSYSRDVFAFPGKTTDTCSEGCNNLIKTNKAALIQSAKDVAYIMGWELEAQAPKEIQKQLFVDLNPEEEKLVHVLKEKGKLHIDELCYAAELSMGTASSHLLNLEFSGVVKSLPGKMYQLD